MAKYYRHALVLAKYVEILGSVSRVRYLVPVEEGRGRSNACDSACHSNNLYRHALVLAYACMYPCSPFDSGGHPPQEAIRPHGNLLQPLLVAGCQDAVHLLRVHVDDVNTDGRRVVAELTGAVGTVEKLPFYIPPPSEELTAGRQQQQGSGERRVTGFC